MILDVRAGWDWLRGKLRLPRATIDFETRSAAELRNGTWLYAKHPTTRVLCLSFKLPGDKEPTLWAAPVAGHEGFTYGPRTLQDLFDWIKAGGLVEAHNVMFERAIWFHVFSKHRPADFTGSRGEGAPIPKDTQWRCSAAKAAAFSLPRALGQAGEAIGARERKDPRGDRLIRRLCKPRAARKGEDKSLVYWHEYDAQDFHDLYEYCRQDVRAEHCLSEMLPDLSDFEYKVWLADMRANWKGIRIDVALVHAAIDLDKQVKRQLNAELHALTDIDAGTKRAQLMQWLADDGHIKTHWGMDLPDSAAPTLDWVMAKDWFKTAKERAEPWTRVLEIARNINRTSVTKFKRVLACMDPDDERVRELIMYCGAATGRWSGKGIQVQNFAKGNLAELLGLKDPSFEDAVRDVKTRDLAWCQALYGDVLALLSSVCRGVLIPSEGKEMRTADYAAIEARVVLWLAEATEALNVFRRGEDIYCDMASRIYGRKITKADKAERQFGKQAILGLGFGMGFLTFLLTLRKYKIHFTYEQVVGILGRKMGDYMEWVTERLTPTRPGEGATQDEINRYKAKKRQASMDRRRLTDEREDPDAIAAELALCKYVVDVYRKSYPEVKAMWADQEDAACKAVMGHERMSKLCGFPVAFGPLERCGKVTWQVVDHHLLCTLPSGRRLVYSDPEIKWQRTPWGEKKPMLRFMGVHKKSRKWSQMGTYGGSETENMTQATARDMMAYAIVALSEDELYEFLTSVHDEGVAECDIGAGDREGFENLMTDLPACYEGCPVAAEGSDALVRYQK